MYRKPVEISVAKAAVDCDVARLEMPKRKCCAYGSLE